MENKVVVNINQYRTEVLNNVETTEVKEGVFIIYYKKDGSVIAKGYPLSAIESFEIIMYDDNEKDLRYNNKFII